VEARDERQATRPAIKPTLGTAATHRELTRQVKLGLADPRKLAHVLGLVNERSERQARGVIVNCPSHEDRGRANCSITSGRDGTVRVKCHACDFKGDALTLVALVHGLDLRADFKQVLLIGAELAGNHALAAELEDGKPRPERTHIPEPRQLPEPPWASNVSTLWESCLSVSFDRDAVTMLSGRGLDVARIEALNLARILPDWGTLPPWATFGRRTWRETGHRLVVRVFDTDGTVRALRAWRVTDGDTPKRLPPSGCRSAGLVLANRLGWLLLRGEQVPALMVVEGEPDWLAATLAAPGGVAVIGIGSGSWTSDMASAAARARRVVAATHPDDAGDRYAKLVTESVRRSVRWRPPSDLDECGSELQALIGTCLKWSFVPHVLGD
jgi:hypothetical protein